MPTDLTTVVFAVSDIEVLAGTVLAALAVLWGVRKLIRTINRS